MNNYEEIVMKHYSQVAASEGNSSLSTMKNEYVRQQETNAITNTIALYLAERKDIITVFDVGCGNGYTLSIIHQQFPELKLIGIEKNRELRHIAQERFCGVDNISIVEGDVLEDMSNRIGTADIVYCQRVVINLLDRNDQEIAYKNIGRLVRDKGLFFCIECMKAPLDNLNQARNEYGLQPIKASFHNLYMDEAVFSNLGNFVKWEKDGLTDKNFLSTHYYVNRVLYDLSLQGKEFKMNSHFVSFFTNAFAPNIGEYSPIQYFCFMKKADGMPNIEEKKKCGY